MTHVAATFFLSAPARPRAGSAPSLLARLLGWHDAWRNKHHLHALPDHVLRDMGFLRDHIDDVLRGAVRRP